MRTVMLFTTLFLSLQIIASEDMIDVKTDGTLIGAEVIIHRHDPLTIALQENKELKEIHLQALLKFDPQALSHRSKFDVDFLEETPTLNDILRENAQLGKKIEALRAAVTNKTSSTKQSRLGESRFGADW